MNEGGLAFIRADSFFFPPSTFCDDDESKGISRPFFRFLTFWKGFRMKSERERESVVVVAVVVVVVECVLLLLRQHGNSALHEAAWRGYSQTATILVRQKNCNVNAVNRAGFTPLHLCCQNGHNETCRVLLLANASPNAKNHVIIFLRHRERVKNSLFHWRGHHDKEIRCVFFFFIHHFSFPLWLQLRLMNLLINFREEI